MVTWKNRNSIINALFTWLETGVGIEGDSFASSERAPAAGLGSRGARVAKWWN